MRINCFLKRFFSTTLRPPLAQIFLLEAIFSAIYGFTLTILHNLQKPYCSALVWTSKGSGCKPSPMCTHCGLEGEVKSRLTGFPCSYSSVDLVIFEWLVVPNIELFCLGYPCQKPHRIFYPPFYTRISIVPNRSVFWRSS